MMAHKIVALQFTYASREPDLPKRSFRFDARSRTNWPA